jgi:protein gp37
MEREWVVSLRDQCRAARVPFFFKQWGGVQKKKRGRELDGRVYSAFPPARTKRSGLRGLRERPFELLGNT